MADSTTLFRARVSARRLKQAEKILGKLGLKPGDAFSMMLAQIELRKGLPFEVRDPHAPLLTSEEQAEAWKEAFGAY
jgi:addiction module RelB/DinJ family antitoxin